MTKSIAAILAVLGLASTAALPAAGEAQPRRPNILFILALIWTSLVVAAVGTSLRAATKPNIVFFLVDDMGWQETSVAFHTEVTALNRRYRTPNMERLAAQGMKFTQAYASAVCSPTRVSALTGMNVARHRVTNWTLRKNASPDNSSTRIEPPAWNVNGICTNAGIERSMQVTPLPALLRAAGYRTIHVGKAHFGAQDTPGENPLNLGFDVNIAGHCAGGPGSYWGEKHFSAAWRTKPPDTIWDVPGLEAYHGKDIYLTEALTLEAIKAMEQAVADQQPFYVYMAHYAVHAPWEKDDRFYQEYVDAGLKPFEATLASMIEGMDRSLGDLMATLDRLGVGNNTIILFMSDNGSPSQCPPNQPLRGHKLTPYEGGIREPMIVKWPGVTQPGSVCRESVVIEDFFPTILELAGADSRGKTLQAVDGVSFVPLLKGEGRTPSDRAFVWHFPNNYGGQTPFSAIRQGPWKLIYHQADRRLELFNIDTDIGETRDLAKENPAKVTELAQLLGERLRAADAQMPTNKVTGKPIEWPDQVIGKSSAVRVACLGDSITFGTGASPPERYSYPVQLAALLGSGYEVRHFGVGGTTLLAEGDKPYRRQPQWQAALDFDPDVVLLLLGANDTCGAPRNNWDRSAAFVSDARSLLQSLRRPGRRVIVALPSPFYPATPGLKPERKEDLEARSPRLELIRGWWREAARAETAEVVDLAGTLAPDSRLTGDGVHPTNAGYGQIAARFRDAILGQPAAGHSRNDASTRVPRTALKVPESALAKALVWQGVAIAETNYTIWGASPVVADGRYHLFAARWPEASVDPAWRKSSEIARYVSDQPEGPFRFQEVVLTGTGRTGEWDAFAPHNPEIHRFGDTFALCYIANSDFHQPPHPLNQQIGMVVSSSVNGPWKRVGKDGLILGPSPDPRHFSHGKQVVNPALLKVGDKFHLYYKTRGASGTLYGLAVAGQLAGPYRMRDEPLTTTGVFIEDASAFQWDGRVCAPAMASPGGEMNFGTDALTKPETMNFTKTITRLLTLLALGALLPLGATAQAKKLKVFILAGQSNMEGHAKVETFDCIGDDPATAPLLRRMLGPDGKPRVCDHVWISYFTGPGDNHGEGVGKLTAGYGSRRDPAKDGGKIGPEFTFGITMDAALDGPVLLIKTAWGGKSLHTDFRPPSAGPYQLNDYQKKLYYGPSGHGVPKDMEQWLADKKRETGHYYRLMLESP